MARFKKLTEEQKHLLASAKKQEYAYTEGVVLSSKLAELFRAVPPSLTLALAMSEAHQKAERKRYMDKFGISETAAAKWVTAELDQKRGISRFSQR